MIAATTMPYRLINSLLQNEVPRSSSITPNLLHRREVKMMNRNVDIDNENYLPMRAKQVVLFFNAVRVCNLSLTVDRLKKR